MSPISRKTREGHKVLPKVTLSAERWYIMMA